MVLRQDLSCAEAITLQIAHKMKTCFNFSFPSLSIMIRNFPDYRLLIHSKEIKVTGKATFSPLLCEVCVLLPGSSANSDIWQQSPHFLWYLIFYYCFLNERPNKNLLFILLFCFFVHNPPSMPYIVICHLNLMRFCSLFYFFFKYLPVSVVWSSASKMLFYLPQRFIVCFCL